MTSSQSNISTLVSATAVGAVLSAASLMYLQQTSKQRAKEAKLRRVREKKNKAIEKMLLQEFLEDSSHVHLAYKAGGEENAKKAAKARRIKAKKESRRVKLCFDDNDCMVEKEIGSDSDEATPRVSEVTANLGDRAFDKGKSKVTTDIFDGGKDKLKNAEAFIENLEKTRRRHIVQKKTGHAQKSELELLLEAESPRLTEEVLTT